MGLDCENPHQQTKNAERKKERKTNLVVGTNNVSLMSLATTGSS
jgi:hypothetical protein